MKTFRDALLLFRSVEDETQDAENLDRTLRYRSMVQEIYLEELVLDFLAVYIRDKSPWKEPPNNKITEFLLMYGQRAMAQGVMVGIEMEKP